MRASKIIVLVSVIFTVTFISTAAYTLDSLDFLTGYLSASLDESQPDYEAIPLLVGLNFNAKPFFEKFGVKTKGDLNFVIEPFINTVIEPDTNIEVGSNFLIKYVFPLTKKLQPYIKGGVGALYMSQDTKEQGTKYNFLPQVGGGIRYFIKDDVALNVEYRFRHLSNASIKSPNSGIDADLILGGISFFFK